MIIFILNMQRCFCFAGELRTRCYCQRSDRTQKRWVRVCVFVHRFCFYCHRRLSMRSSFVWFIDDKTNAQPEHTWNEIHLFASFRLRLTQCVWITFSVRTDWSESIAYSDFIIIVRQFSISIFICCHGSVDESLRRWATVLLRLCKQLHVLHLFWNCAFSREIFSFRISFSISGHIQ